MRRMSKMKKLGFVKILLIILFLMCFLSCTNDVLFDVSIKNDSSKTVTYTYNGSSDTLSPGESKIYKVQAHTPKPQNISVSGVMSVVMSYYDGYVFKNVEPISLHISNKLAFPVELSAGKYLEPAEIVIPANDIHNTAMIYTTMPNFTVSPVLATVEWKLNGDTMNVIIQ